MKFSIPRSKFLETLQKVQNIATTSGTLQILQNALISAADNRLLITTTDLDIAEKCAAECEVEAPGSTTLPVHRLTGMIRELNEDKVFVNVDADDVATLQCGSSFYKIIGMPERDFPPIPETDSRFSYTLDQGVFREMLRKTSYAASSDETRKVLNGVLLSFKDKKLTMVATDGRRLALVEHEIEFPENSEADLILPAKAVAELTRILGNDGVMKIFAQKNQAIFEMGAASLSTKLIDGIYPNYRQVIPGECDERVTLDREQLLSTIRRVALVTTERSNAVKMLFSANQLTISSSTPNIGEARDTLPIKYAGKEITIIFNPEFVMDPLKRIDDDEVYLELNDGHNPALLKCSIPFLYVLMPLRI